MSIILCNQGTLTRVNPEPPPSAVFTLPSNAATNMLNNVKNTGTLRTAFTTAQLPTPAGWTRQPY